jgi:hypothetical protein
MLADVRPSIWIVWRGDAEAERVGLASNERLRPVFDALAGVGATAEPVIYRDEVADGVRRRLARCDGVLAWVDPVGLGETRALFDRVLRDIGNAGVWIGSHPDVIDLIGTKDVLYDTRFLGWGSDVRRYDRFAEFVDEFPAVLASGPRVLKPRRGNGGIGVWKVELVDTGRVRIHQADARDTVTADVSLPEFLRRFDGSFEEGGRLIDQPFQPRIVEGLIRVYLVANRVVGFATQSAQTLLDTPGAAANVMGLPSSKTMFGPDTDRFAVLRHQVQGVWVPDMQRLFGVPTGRLPALWDCDLILGPPDDSGRDTYVLCEINASCITPYPPEAATALARHAIASLTTV